MATKPYVIAIEEHYADADIMATWRGYDGAKAPEAARRLIDLADLRIAEMDAAGIDLQVISHGAPAVQKLDAESAVRLARQANDRLAEAVRAHPKRFAAFAVLPTPDPLAAAEELERAVTKLGFVGAMVHGLTDGRFIDDKRFWPIFERAQALDVPLYLHPAVPHPAVIDAYYKDYVEEWPMLIRAAWGYNVETATAGIRVVLSGVLDAYPGTKIILGHLGEGLPFFLWRISQALARERFVAKPFREYFTEHFWITTSGFFSNPALQCCLTEMGIDRVMFSIDYPFVDNMLGSAWIDDLPLCAEDRTKLLSGNAETFAAAMNADITLRPDELLYLLVLFPISLAALAITYKLTVKHSKHEGAEDEAAFGLGIGAIFGLVALILGFSFAFAAERFEARRALVVDEATVVGRAYLQADVLPAADREPFRRLLEAYTRARLESYNDVEDARLEGAAVQHGAAIHEQLWHIVVNDARRDPTNLALNTLINTVDEAGDIGERQTSAVNNHVPAEIVMIILLATIAGAVLLGLTFGRAKTPHTVPSIVFCLLCTMTVFTIVDLDDGRRGFIRLETAPLQATLDDHFR